MRVTVEFLAQARVLAGAERCELSLAEGATPRDLLAALVAERSAFADLLVAKSGRLPSALLFVGDEQRVWDSDRVFADGERVLLSSPMSGG